MENTQVIDILHVSLLEIQRGAVLVRQEVQRVERFGLRLGDGRDIRRARLGEEASEVTAGVLDEDALGC